MSRNQTLRGQTGTPQEVDPNAGIVVDPKKPGDATAAITRQKAAFYADNYEPLLMENVARVNDNSLVTAARENAGFGFRDLQQRNARERLRYNMQGGQPAAVQQDQNAQLGLRRSLNFDNTINTARMDQADRNTNFRNSMLDIFNGIDASSMQGLSSASANEAQRKAANEASKSQSKSSTYSTIGTAAMAAAMFFA